MLRSSTSVLALALLSLPVVAGCRAEAAAQRAPREEARAVTQTRVTTAPVERTVRLTGELRGDAESSLAANAGGRVLEVLVDVGDRVKKGDVLARLDTSAAALALSEAGVQAELARARETSASRECARAEELFAAGAIPRAELDATRDRCSTSGLDVRAARVRASQASKSLADGVVRATIDGVVVERFVDPGEYVRPDSVVVVVASTRKLRLGIEVPENHVGGAKPGARVRMRAPVAPERVWEATIDRRGVAVRRASRDVLVEATIDNADETLLPGMYATVDLVVGTDELSVVPASAIVSRRGKPHVFVVRDGLAEERIVALGPTLPDGRATIRRGLGVDDAVVDPPPADLANGSAVE